MNDLEQIKKKYDQIFTKSYFQQYDEMINKELVLNEDKLINNIHLNYLLLSPVMSEIIEDIGSIINNDTLPQELTVQLINELIKISNRKFFQIRNVTMGLDLQLNSDSN